MFAIRDKSTKEYMRADFTPAGLVVWRHNSPGPALIESYDVGKRDVEEYCDKFKEDLKSLR